MCERIRCAPSTRWRSGDDRLPMGVEPVQDSSRCFLYFVDRWDLAPRSRRPRCVRPDPRNRLVCGAALAGAVPLEMEMSPVRCVIRGPNEEMAAAPSAMRQLRTTEVFHRSSRAGNASGLLVARELIGRWRMSRALRSGPEYLAVFGEERDRRGRGFLYLSVLGGLHAAPDAGREAIFVG
jgi:hypothetical protein